jgi:hypothetical protein
MGRRKGTLAVAVVMVGSAWASVVCAAELTPHVYVDFVGKLSGAAYTLGPREIDTTGSFAAHHGTEIVSDSLGILSDADSAGQESFEFDASAFNRNGTTFAGTPFVVEAIFTATGPSASMAPIIDIGGQAFIRFHDGLSAGSWNGSTDSVNNNIQPIPAVGQTHHYAVVYHGADLIDYYMDGVRIFQSTNGSPQQITRLISWGNIRHSSVDGGRQLRGEYDAVAFSTFTGVFDPSADFVLPGGPIPAALAYDPQPEVGAVDVLHDTALTWSPGQYAATHDVYFGAAFDDVNDAGRDNPMDVLLSQGQTETSFAPAPLDFGRTYYWRIDEVNAAPDNTIHKGQVWSFTTEPFAYPVAPVAVQASAQQPGSIALRTIDGSGLDAEDQHNVTLTDMWLTPGGLPAWIQFEFDKVYKLHELWVWNSNQLIEAFLGFGAKDVTIEYSEDGAVWSTLENVPQFAKASGSATYTANTKVALGDVMAKFVKLTITSNWGGVAPQTGLSEVRFFHVPVQAFAPQPADAAADVRVDTDLNWRPGREAASHVVYLSTDSAAVAAGSVPGQAVTDPGYTPADLQFDTEYFWKVDEAGETGTYAGDVWSFTTEPFAAIDDFESYNDDDNRIYDAWIDGLTTESSGSQVGYDVSPFAERTTVHSGRQAMPLTYNNAASPHYSEAERTFDASLDWTAHGADTLSLYFRGVAGEGGNSSEGLYVTVRDKSNRSGTVMNPDPAATTRADWQQWTIPLSDFTASGVDLTAVKAIVVGVGNRTSPAPGGTGKVFIDDLEFGRQAQ